MHELNTLEGEVVGYNVILSDGRKVECWTNSMEAATVPQPLDLKPYKGMVVELCGYLFDDLWCASFVRVILEDGYQEITGKVVECNDIEGPYGRISCYKHGLMEARYIPLNLWEYTDFTIKVAGDLRGATLYRARVIQVPDVQNGD